MKFIVHQVNRTRFYISNFGLAIDIIKSLLEILNNIIYLSVNFLVVMILILLFTSILKKYVKMIII